MATTTAWQLCARRKRAALSDAIPPEWRLENIPSPSECPNVIDWPATLLSEEELAMTEAPPLAILTNVHATTWSAESVTKAFCHRAALAQQLTNCLTEILFDRAISVARELDQYQMDTGSLKGPLHGLPISYMDRFRLADTETSAGFVRWLGPLESMDTEGPLVKHMRACGAIPICKTNVPQSMMLGATTNNIFGPTLNPYNRRMSAGGAAGGEGALLAMKGSPFGWATEIAGSARIPATFNNLFALRVSQGRLPTLGLASSNPDLPLCSPTIGMMSWNLEILQHICRLTLGSSAYQQDPSWLDMPWRETKFRTCLMHKPILGILFDDGHVQPQPPLKRALAFVQQRLTDLGFECVRWTPPSHNTAVENLFKMIGADGARSIRSNIASSGEPPVEQLKTWYFEQVNAPTLSASDYWTLCRTRTDYLTAYHTYWISTREITSTGRPVDGVIMPVSAQAACYEHDLNYFGYSAIVNHLDFTSVAFPVTFVDQNRDIRAADQTMLNLEDAQVQMAYDPAIFDGMPVGLQVMCRRTDEESALALAELLSRTCDDLGADYLGASR